jgi:hypothetical protein
LSFPNPESRILNPALPVKDERAEGAESSETEAFVELQGAHIEVCDSE